MDIYTINDFELDNKSLMLHETLFHNANGYIGVRSSFEEGYPLGYDSIRGQYINGFYDFANMPQAEKLYGLIEEKQTMVNIADTQSIKFIIDDEEFSMFQGEILESSRTLDMRRGVTTRRVKWRSPKGKELLIEIERMTSFEILPLFLIKYSVTSLNFSGKIKFVSRHIGEVSNYFNPDDPRVAGESFKHINVKDVYYEDDRSYIISTTTSSDLSICSSVSNTLEDCIDKDVKIDKNTIIETLHGEVEQEKTITLYKYSIHCDSIRYRELHNECKSIMDKCLNLLPQEIYKQQEQYLKVFWDNAKVEVYGDKELNEAINYNLYQLIQSVGKDRHCNIAAKGLSGEGYEGHYFWDTEMYIQPFFTLTSREISQNLIRYRYSILDYAKENAKLMGHQKGAAFPWRTIMGKECSGYYPSGSAQYHISGDIAYSVVSYYLATKDLDFMKECGAEILIETARLWMDLGNYYNNKFNINEVTGPDEYTCLVNNNYYTNVLAKYNLNWAVKMYKLLEESGMITDIINNTGIEKQELIEFENAANNMYLPYDEKLDINPQDDSFLQKKKWDLSTIPHNKKPLLLHYHPMYLYRFQVCKQADTVLAHFIFEDEQSIETIKNSFEYYEKVTTHDSSLSTCIYSIVASKLGLKEKALDYFGESAKLDLFNTHKNTKDGIHTANMGGNYMAIVYGFAGLRIKESGLFISPTLPNKWDGYKFRIIYENSKLEIKIKNNMCKVKLIEGNEININIYDNKYLLKDEININLK